MSELLLRAMVLSEPELRSRALSVSVVLLQPWSVLMSVDHFTARDLGSAGPSSQGTGSASYWTPQWKSCLLKPPTPGSTSPNGACMGDLVLTFGSPQRTAPQLRPLQQES